jgi:hypothetical protein
MISDIDGRKFFACEIKYADLLEQDNPEKWMLWEKNLQVLEKSIEVKPFEDHECADFSPKK